MNDQILSDFIASAGNSLEAIARDVRVLRASPSEGRARRAILESIFRHTHTLKGTASAAGLEMAAHLAHEVENLLDSLRLGHIFFNEECMDVLEAATAALAVNLDAANRNEAINMPTALVERLRQLASGGAPNTSTFTEQLFSALPSEVAGALNAYERASLSAAAEEGLNIFMVAVRFPLQTFDEEFRQLSARLAAQGELISTLPGLEEAMQDQIGFRIIYATEESKASVNLLIEPLAQATLTVLYEPESENALRDENKNGSGGVTEIQPAVDSSPESASGYGASKLDERIDVTRLFERASRAGEKAALEAGKGVDFEVACPEISVEGSMAELLSQALLHLVRNAVDHGIETSEQRAHVGKAPRGRIRLEALHIANRLVLRVSDDGRGIAVEEIKRAALERGIIQKGAAIGKEDALRLIFRPGFSTAASVTTLSGRGVGLDVVDNIVKELGGEIEVESVTGKGTTFGIVLPLDERADG